MKLVKCKVLYGGEEWCEVNLSNIVYGGIGEWKRNENDLSLGETYRSIRLERFLEKDKCIDIREWF